MPPRSSARSATIPAPALGWNTKDPISEMDPRYALDAENFFTTNGSTVDLRKGYIPHCTNIGGTFGEGIATVAELALQSGTRKLIAINANSGRTFDATNTGSSPTDISNAGANLVGVGGASTGGRAATVNYRNRIFIKDYTTTQDVWVWDGAAANISAAAFTGPSGDDKALFNPQPYKNRLYFVGNDASCWYTSSVDVVTGALTQFDFQSILTRGGKLLFVGGTTKSGDTNQEYFVAISELGEVLLYQGDYPGSTTWSIIGHYYMPPPYGYRSFFYWGANLVIVTVQGVVLLNEVLRGENSLNFLSDKINDQFSGAAPSNTLDTGGVYAPAENLILIWVNTGAFVMSTVNGSWWKWVNADSNMDTLNWGYWNSTLVFAGQHGSVHKYSGFVDQNYLSATVTRNLKLRHAYNYFGNKSVVKQFTEARPILKQSEGLTLTMDVNVDYADTAATSAITDTTDTSYKLYTPKMGLKGIGRAGSIRIDGSVTTKRMSLQATEVFWNEGDIT